MLAIWSLVHLPFLNPACTSGSSWFTYCWSLAWRILSVTLLACEMSAVVQQFEHSLALHFFEIGMKTDLFQSCGHCWVFQICWHVTECNTFTASSFRSWDSSAGISLPLLAFFVIMLPETPCLSRKETLKTQAGLAPSLLLSLGSWCTQGFFLCILQASWAGMRFDFKLDCTPPTILLWLLLCPWVWGIFFW